MPWNASSWIERIVVQKTIVGCCHFSMLGSVIVLPNICVNTPLRLCRFTHALFEVEYSKRAHIPDTVHMKRELSEKVDDLLAALRQAEPEDKWSDYNTQDFFQKYDYLELIKSRELPFDFIAMKSILPMIWHVMCVLYYIAKSIFRFKHKIFVRYRTICYSPYSTCNVM